MLVTGLALGLGACQTPPQNEEQAGGGVAMGNATPAASPETSSPTGTVYDFEAVSDLDATGELISVRTGNELRVGTLEAITAGTAQRYELSDACGDVAANVGTFAIACGTEIRVFSADGVDTVTAEDPVSSAVRTSDGDVVAASHDSTTITVFGADGEVSTFEAAKGTDQLVAAPRGADKHDAVVRVNHEVTTVQDMDIDNGRQGGTLRAGLGVGDVAGGPHGLVLAADTTGSQLLVYNTDDIIRLQMTAPVAESPWAVTWDDARALAWIASTATNTAEGYTLATGVPIVRTTVETVPDARHMVSLPDGTLVLASATGGGLQVVTP
ncbi:hypothetical protein [Corynebacterium sp.]|uniref:hypothetical protein n=1 Tax=Corynebacterium sp. TaxID=1720 RepID=UPI002A90A133|nr:hypothetical protein [Corynebacterium sp.]MDY5784547.1 hypothetical protein [Corynebacterium sp.]